MVNSVDQFGYLSSAVILRFVGISPTRCAAMPYAVGSTLGQTSELPRVLRSYRSAKQSRELNGKCLNVPKISSCCLVENSNWESLLLAH